MSQNPLAPPPQTGQPIDSWLYLLWRRLTATGQMLWSSIVPGSSADVAAAVTDETGSPGSLVFSGNPTLQGLTVEDAAFVSRGITDNATATALTIDSSKNVGIGAAPEVSALLELSSAGAGGPGIAMKKSVTPITDNSMFSFAGYAINTSALAVGGTINFKASENWTTTANGAYIQFRTVKGATTTLGEAARMWDTGAFTAGGPSTAPAIKVTPVASQARWIEVTGATSSGNPKLNTSAGSLELGSTGGTALTINSSGNIGIGATPISTVPLLIYHATASNLTVQGDSSTVLQFQRFSNDATPATINFKKARGTTASQSAVASGDGLGTINFSGWGGSNLAQGVYIQAFVDTYVSTSDVSTYLTFSTRAAATGAPVEALRITSAQRVVAANTIATAGYTVATLPAGTVGDRAYVTDALAPAYGVAVAGGGAVTIPVFYNGAAWICA